MRAEHLALLSALCFASGHIVAKFAMRQDNLFVGLIVSVATGVVMMGVIAAATVRDWSIPAASIAFFAAAGVVGPGIGRVTAMRAIRDAGTSVAIPLQASANPIISSLGGVLLFSEVMDLGRVLALVLIVSGIVASARGGSANRGEGLVHAAGAGRSRLHLALWPLAAGAAYAASDMLRKTALLGFGDAILGTFIGLVASLAVWTLALAASKRLRAGVRPDRTLWWFVLHGLVSAAAVVLLMAALNVGDLSVVSPIIASQPVVIVVLGALLLRRFERLRPGTIAGAVMVFAAITYLSVR